MYKIFRKKETKNLVSPKKGCNFALANGEQALAAIPKQ